MVDLPARPEADPAWRIVDAGFVVTREHEIESIFTTANGLVGTRGSLAEGSPLSAPATYIAGVFDEAPVAKVALARAPEWIRVAAAINGSPLRIDRGEPLEHRRTLDLRQAILWRHWRHKDASGRITRIEGMRLASLADRHLLVQSIALTPENYSGIVTIGTPALSRSASFSTSTGAQVELMADSRIETPEGPWSAPSSHHQAGGEPERWSLEVEIGKTYRLDRIVCVHTSREPASSPRAAARACLERAQQRGIEAIVADHAAAWRRRWELADVVIEGDPAAQRALRFAIYHLISAAHPEDERVSIAARGLTGPAYKGHVFWDTEIYMLPFFALAYPEAARALLLYRYHTLGAARANAARRGYRGALYAWESADSGQDVTPPVVVGPGGDMVRIRVGEQEQHISADVAYAVWNDYRATGDERFFVEAGAEIILETARFWASRARLEDDGHHHIRKVIGPDEYHETVDDNAYTNGMARYNLELAAETARLLARRHPERWGELSARLELGPDEIAHFHDVADTLLLRIDRDTGLIEQFEGYFDLEDIDLAAYEPRTAPMDVLLDRDRLQGSQIVKQPDVVMLLYLLGDRFPRAVHEACFRYYEPRTGHGSSLSPGIHAAMAARLGDMELAMRYFHETAEIDLSNTMGNAASGVHMAALGSLWQAVVFGFAGLSLGGETPRLSPRLPPAWKRLRFSIQHRGERLAFDVGPEGETARPAVEVRP